MIDRLSEEDFLLATEVALGALDDATDAAARARMTRDPIFADAVSDAELRLSKLYEDIEQDPPPSAWEAIRQRIDPAPKRGGALVWKAAAAISTTVAAALAIALFTRPTPPPPAQPLVAALGENGNAALAATFDPGSGRLTITPVRIDLGKSYPQLWIIPEDGEPHSLGMIERDRPSRIVLTPELRALMARGATLAISSEPRGGSPASKPTGPVIASGTINTI